VNAKKKKNTQNRIGKVTPQLNQTRPFFFFLLNLKLGLLGRNQNKNRLSPARKMPPALVGGEDWRPPASPLVSQKPQANGGGASLLLALA